ncbi:hypothetical protein F4777DRAFT_291466 [Nemania sp. FL0916]|nr:hypothetical protein F4777DRAFT_291466 [Nemania sp. FL0916]
MAAAHILDSISDLSPAQVCRLFYVLSAAAVLAVAAVPDTARQLLTQYGARSSDNASARQNIHNDNSSASLSRFVSRLTSIGKVPHSWFIHFYILSLSCTAFWAAQFLTHGKLLGIIVQHRDSRLPTSMTMSQVFLVWTLMGLQGGRRLYEYLAVLQPSSSDMWIIHWLLGNAFYLCTSVSIWIEGSCTSTPISSFSPCID